MFSNVIPLFNYLQNFRYFLSQNLDLTTSMNIDEDHQMFYCTQDGYWNGTLIRMRTANNDFNTNNGNSNEIYELKIYNR